KETAGHQPRLPPTRRHDAGELESLMCLLQLVAFEMDPGVGKVRGRAAGASGLSGELEDAVGVERRATQVAPERLEQGELSLAFGADAASVRDSGRGSAPSEGVRGLVQPSCEQLQGPQMR